MMLNRLLAVASLAIAASVQAQSTADHEAHHAQDASTSAAPTSEGEIRKVDVEQGKLTLKHGPIENLGMPGMTMVFRVTDRKMLDGLKAGDKVRFAADNVNGALTVTAIEVMK